jgi:hypothetical protein
MLMALASFMRLSLMKAAHVAVAWGRVQEIRVSRSFFARCGILLPYPCDSSVNIRLVPFDCLVGQHIKRFLALGRLRNEGHGFSWQVPGHRLQFSFEQHMLGRRRRKGKWETRSVFQGGAADASAVPHRLGW